MSRRELHIVRPENLELEKEREMLELKKRELNEEYDETSASISDAERKRDLHLEMSDVRASRVLLERDHLLLGLQNKVLERIVSELAKIEVRLAEIYSIVNPKKK